MLLLVGLAVVAAGLYYLKAILIPLVLALSLKYTLQPVIEVLSKRPLRCCGRRFFTRKPDVESWHPRLRPCVESVLLWRLPHWLAVCVALVIAFAILAGLGFVVADSVRVFSSKAAEYTQRVQQLTESFIGWMDSMQENWQFFMDDGTGPVAANATNVTGTFMDHRAAIKELASKVAYIDIKRSIAIGK